MKRLALAPLAAIAATLALLSVGAAPVLAANHVINTSAPATLTVGQPTIVKIDGVVAPPAEFWDMSWIAIFAISGNVMPECPADAGSAGNIAEETGGVIIDIALRPNADEAGNFANAVGYTPRVSGPLLICAYLYNESGYTWAGANLPLNVVAAATTVGPGSGSTSGGTPGTAAAPVNLKPPWVTRSGRKLVCHPGAWSNVTGSYAYNWLLDGHPTRVTGARPAYPGPAGRGHRVSCRVTAYGPANTSSAVTSRPLRLR